MKKEEIIKGFDAYANAKRQSSTLLWLLLLFCLIVVISVLVWSYGIATNAQNTIKVVDKSGQFLETSLSSESKLFKVLLENHCSNAVYYANSFERTTIEENQARAIFLINKRDAARVFANYKTRGAYGDALDRGVTYKATLMNIDDIKEKGDQFIVRFTSLLEIQDNDLPVTQFIIRSEGIVARRSPQYPENTSGLYFIKYTQSYEKKTVKDE